MKQLIEEITSVPGVIGACLYSSPDGLKASNLPGIFKPERLAAIGKGLLKLYKAGRMNFTDLTDLTVQYDESVVVVRELQKNLLIIAICDPSFNHNLLSMSFNLLQEEIDSGMHDPSEVSGLRGSEAESKPETDPASVAAEFTELLAKIQERLGEIFGPMAGFVFEEVEAEWRQQGKPEASRIEELLTLIDREINDSKKSKRYRELIAADLLAYGKG